MLKDAISGLKRAGRIFLSRSGKIAVAAAILGAHTGTAAAVPVLQLDIIGGTYDPITETAVSTENPASIVALGTPGSNWSAPDILAETFYLSVALYDGEGGVTAEEATGLALQVNDVSYSASDLFYGVPPSMATQPPLLGRQDVFPTSYFEIPFMFDTATQTATYDMADATGAVALYEGGTGSFYRVFDVSYSGVAQGINLHFDLFSVDYLDAGEIVRGIFAPFSHDAELTNSITSTKTAVSVSEPSSALVFGLSAVVLFVIRRRSMRGVIPQNRTVKQNPRQVPRTPTSCLPPGLK